VSIFGYDQIDTKFSSYSIIELYESIESIRGTVLLKFKWLPDDVDRLEFQDENYRGLFFLYNEILKKIAKSNKK